MLSLENPDVEVAEGIVGNIGRAKLTFSLFWILEAFHGSIISTGKRPSITVSKIHNIVVINKVSFKIY